MTFIDTAGLPAHCGGLGLMAETAAMSSASRRMHANGLLQQVRLSGRQAAGKDGHLPGQGAKAHGEKVTRSERKEIMITEAVIFAAGQGTRIRTFRPAQTSC